MDDGLHLIGVVFHLLAPVLSSHVAWRLVTHHLLICIEEEWNMKTSLYSNCLQQNKGCVNQKTGYSYLCTEYTQQLSKRSLFVCLCSCQTLLGSLCLSVCSEGSPSLCPDWEEATCKDYTCAVPSTRRSTRIPLTCTQQWYMSNQTALKFSYTPVKI